MANKGGIYFPGLNGLRAFAALSVVISHSFQGQKYFGLPSASALPVGEYAVTLFFTLSGFLITYLLLVEKKENQKINILNFYKRRMLRIWPLYFGYILLVYLCYTFLIKQELKYTEYIFLYFIFLPNLAFNLNIYPQSMGHLWSIGIEEQFYFFWPVIVAKVKNLKKFLFIFILVIILLRLFAKILSRYLDSELPYSIMSCMRFDCMAIGALFSVYYYDGKFKNVSAYVWRAAEILFWVLFGITFFYPLRIFSILGDDVMGIVTGFFIVLQIQKKQKFLSLESKPFNFLGKISYGIYVYHPLVIALLIFILMKQMNIISVGNSLVLIILVSVSTILVAFLSYRYYESLFLKFKNRFAIVKSGDEMKTEN